MALLALLLGGGRVGVVEHGAPAAVAGFRSGGGVDWISGPGGDVKRVRLHRQIPAHLVRDGTVGIQPRPRVWKRIRFQGLISRDRADPKGKRVHQDDEVF